MGLGKDKVSFTGYSLDIQVIEEGSAQTASETQHQSALPQKYADSIIGNGDISFRTL